MVADDIVEAEEQMLEQVDPVSRIRETDSHSCCASKAKGLFDWKESNDSDCPEDVQACGSVSFWECSENEVVSERSKCLYHVISL
jgi:hypothetical protein